MHISALCFLHFANTLQKNHLFQAKCFPPNKIHLALIYISTPICSEHKSRSCKHFFPFYAVKNDNLLTLGTVTCIHCINTPIIYLSVEDWCMNNSLTYFSPHFIQIVPMYVCIHSSWQWIKLIWNQRQPQLQMYNFLITCVCVSIYMNSSFIR